MSSGNRIQPKSFLFHINDKAGSAPAHHPAGHSRAVRHQKGSAIYHTCPLHGFDIRFKLFPFHIIYRGPNMGFTGNLLYIHCRQTVRAASAAGHQFIICHAPERPLSGLWESEAQEGNPAPHNQHDPLSFQTVLGRPSCKYPLRTPAGRIALRLLYNNRSAASTAARRLICTADICYHVFFHTYVMFHPGSPFRRPQRHLFTLKAWTSTYEKQVS